jgi:hypothetical protein
MDIGEFNAGPTLQRANDPGMSQNAYTLEWAEHSDEPTDGMVKGPTWEDVEAIITHLDGCSEVSGFVVLSRAENDYFQCALIEEGLIAEYRTAVGDEHFELASGTAPLDVVLRIARTWFDDPASAANLDVWTPLEF